MQNIAPLTFQSTRPIRGATFIQSSRCTTVFISIHAPHTGRDKHASTKTLRTERFQSTRPIRGATSRSFLSISKVCEFQSTRPIRGATTAADSSARAFFNFNPRAPYGARPSTDKNLTGSKLISIHAPHTGRDTHRTSDIEESKKFQSTRPIRGAT